MSARSAIALAAAALVAAAALGSLLARRGGERILHVQVATSLAPAIESIARELSARHKDVRVEVEPGGSLALARRVTELDRPCDLIAVADAEVFDEILLPRRAIAGYYEVCGEHLGVVYAAGSRFAAEVTASSWFDVLRRPGVRVGRADPDAAPAGYRTLLAFQLAEMHYKIPGLAAELERAAPRELVRGDLATLATLVQAGEIDYSFDYRSSARARGLTFLELPGEVDLGDPCLADLYGRVSVEVSGRTPGERIRVRGTPIRYAVAVPLAAAEPALARELLGIILGPAGANELRTRGFEVHDRPVAVGTPPGLAD